MRLCHQISTVTFDYLFQKLTNLRVLLLDEDDVNDDNLYTLCRWCTALETLDLFNCADITDTGLISISKLRRLTELYLCLCDQITDEGVKELTKLLHLRKLYFLDAENVTDDSMKKLAEYCLNLEHLDLSDCYNITKESICSFYNTANKRTNRLELVVNKGGIFSADDDVKAFLPELVITLY